MEIIVKRDFSQADVTEAKLAAARFRKAKATSAVSNVLNVADLGNTVLLCSDHVRQFATPAVLNKYNYRHVVDYPYVMGNCDYCQLHTRCSIFIHLSLFGQVLKTKEQRRRDYEYAAICRG